MMSNNKLLTVAFLDVGQGDSTVLVMPDRTSAILVDCPKDHAVADFLEAERISSISKVIITHTDRDHIEGITSLLENFLGEVHDVFYAHDTVRIAEKNRKTTLRKLLELIRKNSWGHETLKVGWDWSEQGVEIEVIHPEELDIKQAQLDDLPNDASTVLRINYHGKRVLLTGDIEGQGWEWIIHRGANFQADVLKFPHHGSWYSPKKTQPNLADVLSAISPSIVIISVGTNNRYSHPFLATIDNLKAINARILCTEVTCICHPPVKMVKESLPCAGTIKINIDDEGMDVLPDVSTHSRTVKGFSQPRCTNGKVLINPNIGCQNNEDKQS